MLEALWLLKPRSKVTFFLLKIPERANTAEREKVVNDQEPFVSYKYLLYTPVLFPGSTPRPVLRVELRNEGSL